MATIQKYLTSNVLNGGTVVVDYLNDQAFPASTGHYVSIDNNRYDSDDSEISVVLGDTSATITNNTGRTWLSNHLLSVELSTPDVTLIQPMTQTAYDALLVKDPSTLYVIVDNS